MKRLNKMIYIIMFNLRKLDVFVFNFKTLIFRSDYKIIARKCVSINVVC